MPIEVDNNILIVNAGVGYGSPTYEIVDWVQIDDPKLRKIILEKSKYDAVRNGYVSDELLGRFEYRMGYHNEGFGQLQPIEKLSTDNGKPENNARRVYKDDEVGSSDNAQYSLRLDGNSVTGELQEGKNLVALHNL